MRPLQPERWGELVALSQTDEPRPLPHETAMLAAEQGGVIVGSFSLQRVICGSHFWVAREFRGQGVAEALAAKAIEYARLAKMQSVMVTTNPHVELLAHRCGMAPVLGTLFRGDFTDGK